MRSVRQPGRQDSRTGSIDEKLIAVLMGKCRLKGFRRHFCLWALGKMSLEKNIANLKNPRVLISAFLRHSFKGGNLETKKQQEFIRNN
ncbi:TPA: hypothetical protein ACKUIQ_001967, partial [Neisseria gonorrhoeae]